MEEVALVGHFGVFGRLVELGGSGKVIAAQVVAETGGAPLVVEVDVVDEGVAHGPSVGDAEGAPPVLEWRFLIDGVWVGRIGELAQEVPCL